MGLFFAFGSQTDSADVFPKEIIGYNCCHYFTSESLLHFSPFIFILPARYCGDLFPSTSAGT